MYYTVSYIMNVYMHLPYNNTSYALCAYDSLTIFVIDSFQLLSFPYSMICNHTHRIIILQD